MIVAVLGLVRLWVDLNLGVADVSTTYFFGVVFTVFIGDFDFF